MSGEREQGIYPAMIARRAVLDGVEPSEYVGRVIRDAIRLGNPLVTEGDQFVVMGIDAMDGSFYPAGSSLSRQEAIDYAIKRQGMEKLFDDGPEDRFSVYTIEGVAVPLTFKPNPAQS